MTQVVHLDEVEVIFVQCPICPVIGSFKSLLITLVTVLGSSVVASLIGSLIRHEFPQISILTISFCTCSLSSYGTQEKCLWSGEMSADTFPCRQVYLVYDFDIWP